MAQENKIGKNIKKLRQVKDLSQDRLSKLADVSYNSIIKLETGGITNPTIETLQKIAKALEVQVDDLLKGFWNEIIGVKEILFIFKIEDGSIKEYKLSPENEQEIDKLCAKFNNEPADKTANVYKYISDNKFYHDFMLEHYTDLINRKL